MGPVTTVRTTAATNTATLSMPRKDKYKLLWMDLEYTSAAGAGNREVRLDLIGPDGSTIYASFHTGVQQAASNTYSYEFIPGGATAGSVKVDTVDVAIPAQLVIPAGYKLKVHDSANISAGDSMVIKYQIEEV